MEVNDWIGEKIKLPDFGEFPDHLTKFMQEPIERRNCNYCRWLNLTEVEQEHVKSRSMYNEHACMLYGSRVYHMSRDRIHDPYIVPCFACEQDRYKNFERREL